QQPALRVSAELCIVNLKRHLLFRKKYRRLGKVSTECGVCLPYNLRDLCGRFVKAEQERGPGFLRLANALSALYPKDSEEKRLMDAMLLAVSK
ncbi:MAG TPA: hypothetical protein VFS84_03600, partial [Candidatus Binatia bacterium]|nr:hypothetical protein [Candidatus Binatia bacterium]